MYQPRVLSAWTDTALPTPVAHKTRRSVPPDLVHAIDTERVRWALVIKGLEPGFVSLVPRARRLGVRLNAPPHAAQKGAAISDPKSVLSVNAALQHIDLASPFASLIPQETRARQQLRNLERWLCGEVANSVLWFLLQPLGQGQMGAQPLAQNAGHDMIRPILRALDLVAGRTEQQPYLLGARLSMADLTAASVLAPIARKDGWAWAGQAWSPMGLLAGRSSLAAHAGAVWVRALYDCQTKKTLGAVNQTRVWRP